MISVLINNLNNSGFIRREARVILLFPLHRIVFLAILLLGVSSNCSAQLWQNPASGLDHDPTTLYYDSLTNRLIAGGLFRKADNKWITGIAAWNGTQWDSLGHGLDFIDTITNYSPGHVRGIRRFGNYLYCGGSFQRAGYDTIWALARWDGSNWDTVPGGTITRFKSVHDIKVYNNELYICGGFDSVGNVPACGIAKWDGTTWSAIGPNYPFTAQFRLVTKMEFYHGNLYVAGNFDDPSGTQCRLAKWDGNNWTFLTNVVAGGIATVADMQVYNDELYVAGLFLQSVGNVANCIIRWNDTTWRDAGGSVQIGSNSFPQIFDMDVHNGKLYCAGNFQKVGGIDAPFLASWDGTNWCAFGSVFDNTIGQIAFLNDTMYVAGGFWTIDGDSINYIAQWLGGNFVDTCGNATGIIESPALSTSVQVFPNPVSDVVTFQFSSVPTPHSVMVTDNLGREIWRQETDNLTIEFPAYAFANGIYFYTIFKGAERCSGKFIIQH